MTVWRAQATGVGVGVPVLSGRDEVRRLAPIVIAVIALLTYANAISNGYVLDDRGILVGNPLVKSIGGALRAFALPYWPESPGGGQYRPLAIASFATDWVVAGGDPRWLHAMNVFWHVGASVMVWLFAAELLAPAGALAAGLIFALHPVHVEAVANVVGRSECMAAVFVLAALLMHRQGHILASVLFALGLLSKENAIVFLALAVAHDVLLTRAPRKTLAARRKLYATYAGAVVAYGIALGIVFRDTPFAAPSFTFGGASTADRLWTVAAVIPQYARLLVMPASLSADYQPRVIELAGGPTLAGFVGLAMVAVSTVCIVHLRARHALLAFALLWLPITILPVSNIFFVSGVTLAERTLYLPSVGIALIAGIAVDRLAVRRLGHTLVAAAVVLLLMAARTWTRTPVWKDNRAHTLTLLRDHPESYRGHQMAARVLAASGQHPAADSEYRRSIALFGRDPYLHVEAAQHALLLGDSTFAGERMDSAIALSPDNAGFRIHRADLHFAAGEYLSAVEAGQRALVLAPDSARVRLLIALAATRLGDHDLVQRAYGEAVLRHPSIWQFRVGYAEVLLIRGDTAAALVQASQAIALSGGVHPAFAVRERAMRKSP